MAEKRPHRATNPKECPILEPWADPSHLPFPEVKYGYVLCLVSDYDGSTRFLRSRMGRYLFMTTPDLNGAEQFRSVGDVEDFIRGMAGEPDEGRPGFDPAKDKDRYANLRGFGLIVYKVRTEPKNLSRAFRVRVTAGKRGELIG